MSYILLALAIERCTRHICWDRAIVELSSVPVCNREQWLLPSWRVLCDLWNTNHPNLIHCWYTTIPSLSLIKWTKEGIQRFNHEVIILYQLMWCAQIIISDMSRKQCSILLQTNRRKKHLDGQLYLSHWFFSLMIPQETEAKSGIHLIHGIFFLQALVGMQMLSQGIYTFLTTSNKLSALEMYCPIMAELSWLESDGLQVYDAFKNSSVCMGYSSTLCHEWQSEGKRALQSTGQLYQKILPNLYGTLVLDKMYKCICMKSYIYRLIRLTVLTLLEC